MSTAPPSHATAVPPARADLDHIADLIEPGSKVLDIGCGDGALLHLLQARKNVDGRGIELSQRGVNDCVARGLFVVQGDADRDLENYPDAAFDYVVLSQTIQATRDPRGVLRHLLRIGKRAIISFPNFGHWRVRLHLALHGRMPVTARLPYSWYDTPNIHFCTVRDFEVLAREMGAKVEAIRGFGENGSWASDRVTARLNLTAAEAMFLLRG